MLPKKAEDFKKEAKVINYLLSPEHNKIISKTGKDVVNHADLWNAFANMEKRNSFVFQTELNLKINMRKKDKHQHN